MTDSPTPAVKPSGEHARTVLGLGLIVAGLAALTWPMFIVGRLGFLCSPTQDPRESPVCADGVSYLLTAVHIGAASLAALIAILLAYRRHVGRRTHATRVMFGSTAVLAPAIIAFAVIDSPPVDFTPALRGLAVAALSASLGIAASAASRRRASYALAAGSVVVAVAGIVIEPGLASPLLGCASIAAAVSLAPAASRS